MKMITAVSPPSGIEAHIQPQEAQPLHKPFVQTENEKSGDSGANQAAASPTKTSKSNKKCQKLQQSTHKVDGEGGEPNLTGEELLEQ